MAADKDAWYHQKPNFNYQELQKELETLSQDERDCAIRDLFGELEQSNETPEFIRGKIAEMEEETDLIEEKEAYELALFVCTDYVKDVAFQLMFLRAENFDSAKAARRMVRYWDRKVSIFGTEKAFRPITIVSDFSAEDQTALAGGGFRILPVRDSSNRAIMFVYRRYYDNRPTHKESNVRLCWYIIHKALTDESVQRDGLLIVGGNGITAGSPQLIPKPILEIISDMCYALPVKVPVVHWYSANRWVKLVWEHCMSIIGKHYRMRVQQYHGNFEQNLQHLSMFGIHPHMLPPELGGTLDFDYQGWIQTQIAEELQTLGHDPSIRHLWC